MFSLTEVGDYETSRACPQRLGRSLQTARSEEAGPRCRSCWQKRPVGVASGKSQVEHILAAPASERDPQYRGRARNRTYARKCDASPVFGYLLGA